MTRFTWTRIHIKKKVGLWLFRADGDSGILSWIISTGPLYIRYEPYKARRQSVNLMTDGRLEGVYPTLEAAKSSIVKRSPAEHHMTAR